MENLRLLVEKETIVKKTGISVVKSKIFSEKAQIIGRKSRNFKRNLDYQFLTDKPGIIIKKNSKYIVDKLELSVENPSLPFKNPN